MADSAVTPFEARLRELAERGVEGVVEFADAVVAEGIRRGASDIHVEPFGDALLVRFRLDGVLHPALQVPTECPTNVVSRFKVLADLLTYQSDMPQEGRIPRERVNAPADLRVSSFPTVRGEKVVVRLFDPETQDVRLEALGYPPAVREELELQIQNPGGILLLTGPAGSGKTTTIYAALRYLLEKSGGARHVVTVEDPVERMLPGVTQTQVHPGTGLTFARCLRSLMRQDPEVIVIGEIRDRETAEIAMEAGLTGHLVISTIHSGSAAGVFTRLLEMKIEPYLASSAVNLIVAQRLVRRLCPECRRPVRAREELLGLPGDLLGRAQAAAGCDQCFNTGYRGRTVLVEALKNAKPIREEVLQRAATETIHLTAISQGMRPLHEAALEAVAQGVTSPGEIRRVLGQESGAEGT